MANQMYRSRVSVKLATILGICGIIFSITTFALIEKSILLFLLINITFWGTLWGSFDIKYLISENTLIIKCAFFKMGSIDIMTIKSIEKSSSIISSPAASLKRISLTYGKYDDVVISPRNQEEFIQDLLKINPNIKVCL
ncbi:MAG: PH domain-containing protein [Prevotellaceae bacterium]|nr:PH domain-containing protein [Candidatus Colivivens equi]